jgi:hypothetical protein
VTFCPELATPLGVRSSPQLAEYAAGRRCWRLCGGVAVLPCCTVYRISSSGRGRPYRFVLDQRPKRSHTGCRRAALNCRRANRWSEASRTADLRFSGFAAAANMLSKSARLGPAKGNKVRDLGRLPCVMCAERSWTWLNETRPAVLRDAPMAGVVLAKTCPDTGLP